MDTSNFVYYQICKAGLSSGLQEIEQFWTFLDIMEAIEYLDIQSDYNTHHQKQLEKVNS